MELPKILNTKLHTKDDNELDILNAVLKYKKGMIQISGFLDKNQFTDYEDFKSKLGLNKNDVTVDDFLTISATNEYGDELFMTSISYLNIDHINMKVKLISYGHLRYPIFPSNKLNDHITGISVEGLSMIFRQSTNTDSTRRILNKLEKVGMSSKRDYSVHKLNFTYKKIKYDLNISFIQDSQESAITHLVFQQTDALSLLVYNEIKMQLRSFLSFPNGNTLVFRKESVSENGKYYDNYFSSRKVQQKIYSRYIPISEHFSNENVLQDYLNCFDNFLIMDYFFDLTDVIFLFNSAKKASIESAVFLMLIAIEKLGDRFLASPFNAKSDNFIIDQNTFNTLIANTKKTFESDLKGINSKDLGMLKSKFGTLNQKAKTDKKIDNLLEFAEIIRTTEIDNLFPVIRNMAIHEGKINRPNESGYSNYNTLKTLLNDIILNIIQYKGFRYIGRIEGKNRVLQKVNYLINTEDYR